VRTQFSTRQKYIDTGVIATIYPYNTDIQISIIARRGVVDIEGSGYLTPSGARMFAEALNRAAEIAELGYDAAYNKTQGAEGR
jgi:hypothetical protein